MATQNKNIKVTELDFDEIKSNLKNYLKTQPEFTDYNFEGSGMSVLLDVLAYNTHYNALYYNLSVNEMFLDSAVKRSSVVSLAKMLGYIPKSSIAARAKVNISVSNVSGNPTSIVLPRGTIFRTNYNGTNYNFNTESAITATRSVSNTYLFSNVTLIEGTNLIRTYTVGNNVSYVLPNPKIDTTTLKVLVQEDPNSAATTIYNLNDGFTSVGANSRVYFLKERDDGLFEIYFGDGLIGYKPTNGSIVTLDYFSCNENAANDSRVFTYTGNAFTNTANVTITTTTPAAGGTEPESIESIKYNAPRYYAAQNRAVTADDYKVIIPKLYNNVDAISVWGGEENDPPIYGKAFICIKPKTGTTLTQSTKTDIITNIVKSKNLVSILPEIVDPEILYINVDSTVYYNPKATTRGADTIKTIVSDVIENYNTTNLNRFDSIFRESVLSKLIDNSEDSIVSNITKIKLKYELTPSFNNTTKYTIKLNNPLYHNTNAQNSFAAVTSSGFNIAGSNYTYFIEDNTIGNLRLYYLTASNAKVYTPNYIGTVDYTTGKIQLDSINISSGNSFGKIVFTAEPNSYDVISVRNQLSFIREQDIIVNVIADKIASGESSSGKDFIFTSSR